MGSDGVVVGAPSLDDPPRLGQRGEGVLIEAFIAQPAVEALHEGILDRLAGGDVMPFDSGVLGKAQDCPAHELRAVVGDDHAGTTAPGDQLAELAHDAGPGERSVDHRGQALAREVVDDVQHPEAAPIVQRIGDEVQAPALVRSLRHRHRRPRTQGPLAAAAAAHREPLLPVEPVDLLQVHSHALPPQQDRQPPIAEPAALVGQLP